MLRYILRRTLYMIPILLLVSVVSFAIIQLPPGDYLSTMIAQYQSRGISFNDMQIAALERRYGLGQPFYIQYYRWISNILLYGDFGQSFQWNRPVADLIWERLPLTMTLAVSTMLLTWAIALPIGIYSAVRQYSLFDYVATFFGFLGLAIPNFLLALVLLWVSFEYFGQSVGGLFSPSYINAPWSFAKFVDLLKHLWIPVVILATAGTAGLIRIMRANLIDELHKPYVVTARSKGMTELRLLLKYPVRLAINPFISTIGWLLPVLISGEIIVSVVLSLETTGPLLLRALLSQDMYLAGSFIFILSVLTVVGTLLSDILLAWIDPRIRFE